MEIATAILPVVLEPAISILWKKMSRDLKNIEDYQHDLTNLPLRVSLLKGSVAGFSERYYCSTEVFPENLLEPVKIWLEKCYCVIEDAESTIAECNYNDQASTCCMPRFDKKRGIQQAIKNIRGIFDLAPMLHQNPGFHILSHGQTVSQLQDGGNGCPPLMTQMIVTREMPRVLRRLQGTASTVTLSTGLLSGEIDNYSPNSYPRNPPISVIVNRSDDEGNLLALTHDVGDAGEMTIPCCEGQIVIFTNSERVHEIDALSERGRWEVFHFIVFDDIHHREFPLYRNEMEEISRAIFRSNSMTPYLIEGIAHTLAKFYNPYFWHLKLALFSSLPESLYDRFKALPKFVRLCFLSCTAFRQAEEIDVENLLELWIAEDLLGPKYNSIDPVSVGCLVIKLLLRYRLIEVSAYDLEGRPVRCTLPIRIYEMAVNFSDEACFFMPGQDVELFPWPATSMCRSISLIGSNILALPPRCGSPYVSSLLLARNERLSEVPDSFLQRLTLLRVLDLSDTGIVKLPKSLGDLTSLVHLNLSRTQIIKLSKSRIIKLKKLRFLHLSSCIKLKSLTPEIDKLQSLELLDVSGCQSLTLLPRTIMELKQIQVLKANGTQVWHSQSGILQEMAEFFSAGPKREAILSDLKALINLKRLHLDSEEDSFISDGVMGNMRKMQSLLLRMPKLEHLPDDMTAMTELCELQLWKCKKLQALPSWVCDFLELRFLCLNSCYSLRSLPCLETLPLLRVLQIVDCDALMKLPCEFGRDGAFPALQSFTLRGLKIRSLRISRGAMPMLMRMTLQDCKNLERLPQEIEHMENLQTLDITGSELLIQCVASRSNLSAPNSRVRVITVH